MTTLSGWTVRAVTHRRELLLGRIAYFLMAVASPSGSATLTHRAE